VGISRRRRYESGCWTPEFRLWLDSIFLGADRRIQERLEERAREAGDREIMFGNVASAVNTIRVAITEARETLEREDPVKRAIIKRVHDNP
jgi:hypothetical protein